MLEIDKIDTFTVLNYQGSKKNLLEFIYDNVSSYLDPKKAFLDIFAGTSSVGYAFKRDHCVYSNDAEHYASIIARALIQNNERIDIESTLKEIQFHFNDNFNRLLDAFHDSYFKEQEALENKDFEKLKELYKHYPVIWKEQVQGDNFYFYKGMITSINDLRENKNNVPYMLFTTYYAQSYYGVCQAMIIDSLRYAIEKYSIAHYKPILLTALFYAMKECVFSKDGHMAQPLSIEKNQARLLTTRAKDVYAPFVKKLKEFSSPSFVTNKFDNKVFNSDFKNLFSKGEIKEDVGFIYIDPPYTDMQYSRYYHLLNTVSLYDYPDISLFRGKTSKGIYRQDRFQSDVSKKSKALFEFSHLFSFAKENKMNFAFSFAYPENLLLQASNRYTAAFDDIVFAAEKEYGSNNLKIVSEKYQHSNNRNKDSKKVYEYLILGKF